MNTSETQIGLNDLIVTKIQNRIARGANNAQSAVERLINEGKTAQDFIAPIGVENRENPIMTFAANGRVNMVIPNGEYGLSSLATSQLAERFGVPAAYLRNLANGDAEHRALAARVLNDHTGWTPKKTRAYSNRW